MQNNKDKTTFRHFLNDTYSYEEAERFFSQVKDADNRRTTADMAFEVWEDAIRTTTCSLLENERYKQEARILLKRIGKKNIRPLKPVLRTVGSVAAVIAIIFSLSYLFLQTNSEDEIYTETGTGFGEKRELLLPDGSAVVLNACSKLCYPVDFSHSRQRKVVLSGEAYFDVAKDVAKPFIVNAGHFDVHVLGTAFNVKSYETDDLVAISVERGKVEVEMPEASVRLAANEQMTVNTVSGDFNNVKNDEPYKVGSSAETWYYEVYRMFLTLPVFLPNGDFAGLALSRGNLNVIGHMAKAGRSLHGGSDMWYTGRFDLHPLKGLSVKGNYTLNKYFSRNKIHRKTVYQTMPEGVPPVESGMPNFVSNRNSENTYQTLNLWAEYNWNIDAFHNFKVIGGYNQEGKDYKGLSFKMSDLFDNETPISDLAINYVSNSETDTRWRVQGLFCRINYDFKSKYLMELNGRYDGSSKFPAGKRHVFVPSASAGWRISEENFFSPLKNRSIT